MDLELKGKVALIQGASKGIGRGIAEALAQEGMNLFLTARTESSLKQAAAEISNQHGVTVHVEEFDSGNLDGYPALIESVKQKFGSLDVIVANSGGPTAGQISALTPEDWRKASDLLILSPVQLLKSSLPLLEKSTSPRMLIVTSASTREPVPGLTLSNTFRPAILGLIKEIAGQYASLGLRVHSLAPGRIDTDRLSNVFENQAKNWNQSPEEVRAAAIKSIPVGRIGDVSDMGNLAAFLVSPKADYLTGQNWLVDGGLIKSL